MTTKTLVLDPNCEVTGKRLIAILSSIYADEYTEKIEKHGLTEIQPDRWYPARQWVDFLNDLRNDENASHNFVAIGMEIAAKLPLAPPEMTYEQILMQHPDKYQQGHRNGYAGEYQVEQVADKHYRVTLKVPYPDDMMYGSLWGEAKRYLPSGTKFRVYYDEDTLRRDAGGDVTIINIEWE